MNVSRLRRPALVGPLLMMVAPFAWAQTADQAPTELDTVTVEAAPKAKKAKAKPKPTPAPQSASVPPPADMALDPTDLTLDGTVVTEGSGSYSAEASTIGGKLVLPLKDTPRSISVLTRKRLDDENMTSIAQAAERATGVYVRNEGDVSDGPFFYARGFTMSVSENGVPFDTTFYGPGLDTAIYDRIEVLRGPDGLMQGQGQLGGSMNLVRKAPLAAPQVKTELVAGQWGNLRSVFDISTPAANGKIRTRVVGSAETRESFVDYVGQERYLGYGIVEIDVTERTTVTLSAMKQDNEVNPYFGALHVPGTDGWTPRDLYMGARWSTYDFDRFETSAKIHHRFNGDWSLVATATRREYDDTKRFAFHNPNPSVANGTSPLLNRATWFEAEQWTGDVHLTGAVHAFGRRHDLAFGANFERFDYERWIRNAPSVGFWPIGNPDVPYVPLTRLDNSNLTWISQDGYYAQGRFEIVSWLHAHLGGRLSNYKSETRPRSSTVTTVQYDESEVFTPYGGLVVTLNRDWTAYASYADIFRPQSVSTLDSSDNVLPPLVGEQYEVGIKGSLFNGALIPSFSIFLAHDTNRAIRDPNDPSAYIAAGEVESRGFEIEVAARPVKNWDIVAGYTYTETEFTAGQPAEIGQRFNSFFPKHSFKLWSNYTFDGGGLLDGVALGVGVRAFSESTAAFTSPYLAEVEQPAYAVVDGRLGYALTDSTELSLNVTNIFDEVYIPYPGVRAFYGEPRRALAKIVTTW